MSSANALCATGKSSWQQPARQPDRSAGRPQTRARLHAIALFSITAPLISQAASPFVEGLVVDASATYPVIIIDRGTDHGVRQGDRAVVHDDRRVIAAGEIVYATASKSGVSVRRMPEGLPDPCHATVVTVAGDVPYGGYRVANVDSALPGGGLLWIKGGNREGWRVGDAVLARAANARFAWGSVVEVGERAALVDLGPTAAADAGAGSVVEQIGSALGATRTRVIAVGAGVRSKLAVLAGGRDVPIDVDDRVDFFRDGVYAGFGRVTSTGAEHVAEWVAAFSPQQPSPGDEAIVRGRASTCAAGYVFRVEGDYCLVSVGQNDGVKVGETLIADSGEIELSVQTAYPDHCGASLLTVSPGASLRLWMGVRRNPGSCEWNGAPLVETERSPFAPWLVEVKDLPGARRGEWIALSSRGTMALVSNVVGDRVYAVRMDHVRRLPVIIRGRDN